VENDFGILQRFEAVGKNQGRQMAPKKPQKPKPPATQTRRKGSKK
jgi:hypothetical protein